MKGKATCPNCNNKFIVDIPTSGTKKLVVCPRCEHKFNIKAKCETKGSEVECTWEEHGEPRKTVLSSIKPKTNRPMIAAIILVCVFAIGINTAVFSETFVESSMDVASQVGLTGTVEFEIVNENGEPVNNTTVSINSVIINRDNTTIYKKENIEPGIQEVVISKDDYTKKSEVLVTPFITSKTTFRINSSSNDVKKTEFNSFGCSIIIIIFSVFSIFSVITCLKREHLDVAIAGSFLAIFSFGFFFIGSILSIVAFVIILLSREEFKNGDKGKIF